MEDVSIRTNGLLLLDLLRNFNIEIFKFFFVQYPLVLLEQEKILGSRTMLD